MELTTDVILQQSIRCLTNILFVLRRLAPEVLQLGQFGGTPLPFTSTTHVNFCPVTMVLFRFSKYRPKILI